MANKKQYRVPVTYTYTGYYLINAESREQAKEMVKSECYMSTYKCIHTTLDDDENPDWKFPTVPETQIKRITLQRKDKK
jgi:hypothetical protein